MKLIVQNSVLQHHAGSSLSHERLRAHREAREPLLLGPARQDTQPTRGGSIAMRRITHPYGWAIGTKLYDAHATVLRRYPRWPSNRTVHVVIDRAYWRVVFPVRRLQR